MPANMPLAAIVAANFDSQGSLEFYSPNSAVCTKLLCIIQDPARVICSTMCTRHGRLTILAKRPLCSVVSGMQGVCTVPGGSCILEEAVVHSSIDHPSDWAVAALLIYNREISEAEVVEVENFLSLIYGIPLDRPRDSGKGVILGSWPKLCVLGCVCGHAYLCQHGGYIHLCCSPSLNWCAVHH